MSHRELLKRLLALYDGSPLFRLYSALKLWVLPLVDCARHLPTQGRILDVGCGYGYLTNYLSLDSPKRHVIGHDVAADRIELARRTVGGRTNVEFLRGEVRDVPDETFDGAAVADVLHHVPYEEQAGLLAQLYGKLKPGGVLLVRETDRRLGLRYLIFHQALERLLYARSEKLRFRPKAAWAHMLRSVGFELRHVLPSPPWFPYVTATFVCAKPAHAVRQPGNRSGSDTGGPGLSEVG